MRATWKPRAQSPAAPAAAPAVVPLSARRTISPPNLDAIKNYVNVHYKPSNDWASVEDEIRVSDAGTIAGKWDRYDGNVPLCFLVPSCAAPNLTPPAEWCRVATHNDYVTLYKDKEILATSLICR